MKIHKPKTISEAINDLEMFLECDLYSKFRPAHKLPTGKKGKKQTWYRQDCFLNEEEFIKYIRAHFDILEKQVKQLNVKEK